ncbi:MAG: cobyric acid synthase [Lachnospiraceae bacterium]|nr:cobyric acid synthase [Lachnospiraceae bacterium]
MVQGTMSNVGKSLIAAGLCRIFMQDCYRVSPFKSQNMALNSFVTKDGKEMSRAQVLQAAAAKVEPDVRMNPVLIKPTGDMNSQVIVNGKAIGNYPASEYFKMKKSLIPEIRSAYDSLAAENDIIVIEGAGSPAEINLREDDIVNMGLAELVDAPVILVGDIDPGGVFAQLYGTMELLRPEERKRVVGVMINKFRGDIELLKPGLGQIEKLTGVPVLGVIPYTKFNLDGEDSLSYELNDPGFSYDADRALDVAVIRYPHISNYTDVNPLALHPAVSVRYAESVRELSGQPDLIILPGTKNTLGDLRWLKDNGLYQAVLDLHKRGSAILGICGGYQMLGESISDPYFIEDGGDENGLGLLPVKTVFEKEKLLCGDVAKCTEFFGSVNIRGYQTHSGVTDTTGLMPFCRLADGRDEGVIYGDVFGTYMHGLFDTGELTSVMADHLLKRKGLKPMGLKVTDFEDEREKQLDLLAWTMRDNIDLDGIYRALR